MKNIATACRLLPICALFFLAACAGDIAKPTVVQSLTPAQQSSLRTSSVTGEAGTGVFMAAYELDRVMQEVNAEIERVRPGLASDGTIGPTTKIKIVFTEYDKGNAFARAMLAGLGQIKISADVIFVDDQTGNQIAKYTVEKDFALGGIYGASTRIEDVEVGFAKSVAAILTTKA